MPYNIEAEESILGGILIDPFAIKRVANILRPEALSITAHQHIYRAALALHSEEQPADLMTVTTFLADRHLYEIIGLKGRNSGTGTVKLLFDAECCRFRNIYQVH